MRCANGMMHIKINMDAVLTYQNGDQNQNLYEWHVQRRVVKMVSGLDTKSYIYILLFASIGIGILSVNFGLLIQFKLVCFCCLLPF